MIALRKVSKVYGKGNNAVFALNNINLDIRSGKFTAIVGQSGSGKSTLMHLISALDKVSSGDIFIDDVEITKMGYDQLADFRNRNVGFVFQAFYLEPTFSVLDNVCLPLEIANVKKHIREEKAKEILQSLGLGDKFNKKANDLSGGEKQRVAIARALVNDPNLLLADEPTGNLDSVTGKEIMNILRTISSKGKTVVMVTHNMAEASIADDIITINDGKIESILRDGENVEVIINDNNDNKIELISDDKISNAND